MTDPIYIKDPPVTAATPPITSIWDTNIAAPFESEGNLSAQVQPKWPSARPFLTDAMLKHQQECGCVLPMNKAEAPTQKQPDGRVGWVPIPPRYFGWQMQQPSWYQNRTTVHAHRQVRQRQPTNPVKLYTVNQFFTDNPSGTPGQVPPTDHGKTYGDPQLAAPFSSEGTLSADIQIAPPPTVGKYAGVVYTQTDVYSSNNPADYTYMNNYNADGSKNNAETGILYQTGGTNVQADLGAIKSVDHLVIGYDYLNNLPGGWGPAMLENKPIDYSTDGTTWTTFANTPTYASTGSTNGLVTIPMAVSARYIRIGPHDAEYFAILEFEIWGT